VTRTAIRVGAVGFLLALAAGLAIMGAGTLVWGDWDLIRLPWGDLGMALITIGLGGSLLFLEAEDLVEPVGRWRLLALPGIVVGGLVWAFLALIGLLMGGACCGQPVLNLVTALYSAPQAILVLVAAVTVTALPLVVTRPWARTVS
jgi:hypothetical protein